MIGRSTRTAGTISIVEGFSHMQHEASVTTLSGDLRERAISFALGGGNALGAYHFGVCERLLDAGAEPRWITGTSIGAVTGAILVGNPPERRLARLREFWEQAAQASPRIMPALPAIQARINNDYGIFALLFGRPGLFRSRFPGIWSLFPGMPPDRALRDHAPLARTLERLIDFEYLNGSAQRLSIVTLDMESGAEVWFDNHENCIGPRQLLAATALAPLFPPVEIDGRLLCDAGFGNNLPFDRIFHAPLAQDALCFGLDTYSLGHGRPGTLDETLARVQDLTFASQTRRALMALRRERRLERLLDPQSPSAMLAHLAYRAPGNQRTLKPLDFSRSSLEERRGHGRADADAVLAALADAPRDEALAYLGPLRLDELRARPSGGD